MSRNFADQSLAREDLSGPGGGSLQDAYDFSLSPEIVLDATRGALTIQDAAVSIAAPLLEVLDTAGTNIFAVTVDAVDAILTHTNGAVGFMIVDDSMFKVRASSTAFVPQLAIEAPNPRFDIIDTTPTNGDTWALQLANNNLRIRNTSNSDGELRLEERLDLNRQYDPATSAAGIITFDPSFSYQSLATENYILFNPTVEINANLNSVVLLGAGSWEFQSGATTALWTMFRATPSLFSLNSNQVFPSPLFYHCAPSISMAADVSNFTGQTLVTGFIDATAYDVFDGASAVLDILDHYSFRAFPISENAGAGLLHIENNYSFKAENGIGVEVDQQYGFHVSNFVSAIASYGLFVGEFSGGPDRKREVFLNGAAAIYFREDVAGTTRIYSPSTDNLSLEAADSVFINSGLQAKVTTVTTTSHTAADEVIILVDDDTAGSTVTVTLPAVSGTNDVYNIKKLGTTANVIVDGDGVETIDGGLTAVLTAQYESIMIVSDGTSWHII